MVELTTPLMDCWWELVSGRTLHDLNTLPGQGQQKYEKVTALASACRVLSLELEAELRVHTSNFLLH